MERLARIRERNKVILVSLQNKRSKRPTETCIGDALTEKCNGDGNAYMERLTRIRERIKVILPSKQTK